MQASGNEVVDTTKLDLAAIRDSGAVPDDDAKGSRIADYRKRKLCEKKCGALPSYANIPHSSRLGPEGKSSTTRWSRVRSSP